MDISNCAILKLVGPPFFNQKQCRFLLPLHLTRNFTVFQTPVARYNDLKNDDFSELRFWAFFGISVDTKSVAVPKSPVVDF